MQLKFKFCLKSRFLYRTIFSSATVLSCGAYLILHPRVVSQTFRELCKIISRKYPMPETTFMLKISSRNLVRLHNKVSAWNWNYHQKCDFSNMQIFRKIWESSWNGIGPPPPPPPPTHTHTTHTDTQKFVCRSLSTYSEYQRLCHFIIEHYQMCATGSIH